MSAEVFLSYSIADARKKFAELLNEAHYRNGVFKITKHDQQHAYIVGPDFFVRSYVAQMFEEKAKENEKVGPPPSERLIEEVAKDLGLSPHEVHEFLDTGSKAPGSSNKTVRRRTQRRRPP
jgi:hypothetical protein